MNSSHPSDATDLPAEQAPAPRAGGSLSGAQALGQSVEQVGRVLDRAGVSPELRDECRAWAEQSLRGAAGPASDRPERGLDEVLGVASRALKHVLTAHLGRATGLRDLQSLFKAVEIASSLTPDDRSIETVVEIVRGAADEVLREIALQHEASLESFPQSGEDHEWSLDDLRERVRALAGSAEPLAEIDPDDRSPLLAITLQLALSSDEPPPALRARAIELLRAKGSAAEQNVLPALLGSLCVVGRRQQLDTALRRLAELLGREGEPLWIEVLLRTCEQGELDVLEPLWPHLAERFVCGKPWQDVETRERTVVQLGRWPQQRVFALTPRLQKMPGIASGRLSASALEEYDERLAALYAALVRLRHTDVYAAALLALVRRRSLPWSGALVFRLMDTVEPPTRALLGSLFGHGTLEAPSSETRVMATRYLAQRILELAPHARSATWIKAVLEALGDESCEESMAALKHVLSERRWGVVPAWSSEHRRAAQESLNRLRLPAPQGAEQEPR